MKERTWVVYKHTAPSNKVYIGITCKPVIRRWNSGNGYKNNKHFWRAIQKYGWQNFKHEILFENLSKPEALSIERKLIAEYHSNESEFGYNNSVGGDCGGEGYHFYQSDEVKQRLSIQKRGVPLSARHKQALVEAWERRRDEGKDIPWNKGKKLKDTGQIDNFLKAGIQNIENRKVHIQQIDLKTGNVIAEYDSISDAARSLNKNYTSSIIETARGRRKSAFGYGWRYL